MVSGAYTPYSAIIGRGQYWQKVYFERMVGKYLAKFNLNKTIQAYIINIALEVLEKMQ